MVPTKQSVTLFLELFALPTLLPCLHSFDALKLSSSLPIPPSALPLWFLLLLSVEVILMGVGVAQSLSQSSRWSCRSPAVRQILANECMLAWTFLEQPWPLYSAWKALPRLNGWFPLHLCRTASSIRLFERSYLYHTRASKIPIWAA